MITHKELADIVGEENMSLTWDEAAKKLGKKSKLKLVNFLEQKTKPLIARIAKLENKLK